jgi:hypothetical protein
MSRSYRTGLVILGVLSLLDVAGPLMTDGDHPPMFIALIGSVIGVLSLVCVYYAWQGVRRAVLPLIVLRLLSAASAAPAFFVDDVPTAIRVLAAVLVLVTVAGVAMVTGSRQREAVAS